MGRGQVWFLCSSRHSGRCVALAPVPPIGYRVDDPAWPVATKGHQYYSRDNRCARGGHGPGGCCRPACLAPALAAWRALLPCRRLYVCCHSLPASFRRRKIHGRKLPVQTGEPVHEVMAKTRRWLPFKKGVLWACYLGLSVRWLRKDEPTKKNLEWVYGIMGLENMSYPIL